VSILIFMESTIPHMAPRMRCRKAAGSWLARRGHLLAIACGWGVAWAGAALFAADEADRRPLPEPIRTNRPVFTIPFRLEESKSSDDAPQRVVLSVSRDLGANWQDVDDVVPAARQFTYRATTDGEYWFRLRSIDASGRQRGGAGPDVRVILNAAGPRLAARVWLGPDGEVVCRFAAFDDTLDLTSLRLEYRTAAEPNWQPVDAVAMLSREAPAHLVGEELWWAGDDPKGLIVQLTVSDASGNASTQQYALAAHDPGVSQHELAREIGAPPLPGSEPAPEPTGPSAEDLLARQSPAMRSQPPGFGRPQSSPASVPAQVDAAGSSWLPGGVDAGWGADGGQFGRPGGVASVLTASRPQPLGSQGFSGFPDEPRLPADPGLAFGPATDSLPSAEAAPGFGEMAAATTWADGTYRGKPLMLSRSRRFSWDYAVDTEATAGGVGQVELWGTRDGGVTWQRVAIDEDRTSPIDVALTEAGLHGFRLELSPAGVEVLPPRSGDAPQCWVGVDEVPPTVSIQSVIRSSESSPGGEETIAISYASDDPLIVPRGVRLQFSPNPSGPWATIVEGLESTGRYLWKPDRTVPARAYLRIEASDSAGNVGAAVTPEAVLIGGGRPTGQLRSLRPLPPTPAP
jgi:hypothetical protein